MNDDNDRLAQLALKAYAIERIAGAIENVTDDLKNILTNPLGLGKYLQSKGDKDSYRSYIPITLIIGAVCFAIAMYNDESDMAIWVIGATFIFSFLLVLFDLLERKSKANDKENS